MRKLAFILVVCFAADGFSESRNEIMDKQDRSDYNYHKNGLENMRAADKKAADIYASSKAPGFYEFDPDTQRSNAIAKTITSALSKPRKYDNILVLRLSCIIPDSIITLNVRYKDVTWNLEENKIKGSSQTDGEGFLKIRFSSDGSIKGKTISINLKNISKNIELGAGPYEIFLPEESCKSK